LRGGSVLFGFGYFIVSVPLRAALSNFTSPNAFNSLNGMAAEPFRLRLVTSLPPMQV
jgi:hypothetical protein